MSCILLQNKTGKIYCYVLDPYREEVKPKAVLVNLVSVEIKFGYHKVEEKNSDGRRSVSFNLTPQLIFHFCQIETSILRIAWGLLSCKHFPLLSKSSYYSHFFSTSVQFILSHRKGMQIEIKLFFIQQSL